MKILVNRKPISGPYGGGNLFVRAFCDHFKNLGHKVIHHFESDIDVILMIDPRPDEISKSIINGMSMWIGVSSKDILNYKINYNPSVKIIHRVNENDERKKTVDVDPLLRECSKFTDASAFIGQWIYDYHLERGWHCKNNVVIHSGSDKEIFKPNTKLENGKVNIYSHHWSDNQLKHQGLNEWLEDFVGRNSDSFSFTYIGRTKSNFKNSRHIQPLFGKELGEELGKADVYISATYADPCPNHILESLACKLPTYVHKDGGGAVELAGEDHAYSSFDELEKILLNKKYEMNTKFIPSTWDECMKKYEDLIEELCP